MPGMFFMNSPTSPMVSAPKLSAGTTVLAFIAARRSMIALASPPPDNGYRLGIVATRGGIGKRLQLEIQRGHFARDDGRDGGRCLQAGVPDHNGGFAGRHARKAEIAAIFGIGDDRRALNADL